MNDDIWRRDEIESPCVKICVLHPAAGLCVGCFRTRDEIATWSTMTQGERRAIMMQLVGRRQRLTQRRGGRAARLADQ